MKLKHLFKFVPIVALIIMASCEKVKIEPLEVILSDDPISFSSDIQPVFDAKCISCHSTTNPVLKTGQSYDNLISGNFIDKDEPADSKLYTEISGGHHANFTAEELAKLLKWITDGAENN
ncbi:hypothetical protein ACFLTI_06480 [Bacteroidota bacterium]